MKPTYELHPPYEQVVELFRLYSALEPTYEKKERWSLCHSFETAVKIWNSTSESRLFPPVAEVDQEYGQATGNPYAVDLTFVDARAVGGMWLLFDLLSCEVIDLGDAAAEYLDDMAELLS